MQQQEMVVASVLAGRRRDNIRRWRHAQRHLSCALHRGASRALARHRMLNMEIARGRSDEFGPASTWALETRIRTMFAFLVRVFATAFSRTPEAGHDTSSTSEPCAPFGEFHVGRARRAGRGRFAMPYVREGADPVA